MLHILYCIDTFLGDKYNSASLYESDAIVWRNSNEIENLLDIYDIYNRIVTVIMYCNLP
jgi:hypothetical protein